MGVLDVLKMLKNLETPLGGSMASSARTCKEIMLLNTSLPDGKNQPDSTRSSKPIKNVNFPGSHNGCGDCMYDIKISCSTTKQLGGIGQI